MLIFQFTISKSAKLLGYKNLSPKSFKTFGPNNLINGT